MIDQEHLRDLTESYLKSVISEASGTLGSDFDSFAAFGELGINSFGVLKIIKALEADFGTLPKSLLFENFNVNDLANYFVRKHEQTLAVKFAKKLQESKSFAQVNGHASHTNGHAPKPVEAVVGAKSSATSLAAPIPKKAEPIRILEKEAYAHPELRELVQMLFERHKIEGCVSRGTRKIAPNLFIGSERRGYFNYGRSRNIVVLYAYTGPLDYFPALLEEMYRYCESKRFQLNFLADKEIRVINEISFSSTPFGAMQRIFDLKEFTLDGGPMRRLRYQVSKFQKSGVCKTEEYRCGSSRETDKSIVGIIDRWCAERTMVNPLVHDVKSEIATGTLQSDHRLFLTYLDDVLQNVILISAMCPDVNGYLMDLEFYPPEMPLGGLEFAIVQIVETLATEGCDLLSLGGTYGCKLTSSENADPEIEKILDELREQKIFNDESNLQFKNKFRPENKTVYLCRPLGSGNPSNVMDIIMMIADPENTQTSEQENHNFGKPSGDVVVTEEKPITQEQAGKFTSSGSERGAIVGNERSHILPKFGFNPLNIPREHVEFDLKTDSWAQLDMPAIEAQVKHLHAQLQKPVNVDDSLRIIFPFAHFVLTGSGQEAEHIFFKAWPKKGIVLQNLLFPSTIFHQIDKGFTPLELPHLEVFHLNSQEQYKGNMAWDALQARVAQDAASIAFVCIEVGNNAVGGAPVSVQHLRDVKGLLAKHSIPLVLDGTRVVENAQLVIEQEKEYEGKSVWTVVREIFSCADAVIGSLTKDFCVNKGGIVATSDARLFHRLQELVQEEGSGLDLIDKKMIALSLQNRKQIEAKVLRRMDGVRLLWQALSQHNVPVVKPAGGHCVLIDIKQIPGFKDFKYPAASFLAWMYARTGIRAAAHNVGMQQHTSINELVRLAIPVGMNREQIDDVIDRLVHAFAEKGDTPEVVMDSSTLQPLGAVHVNYTLANRKSSENPTAKAEAAAAATAEKRQPAVRVAATDSAANASKAEQGLVLSENVSAVDAVQDAGASQIVAKRKPRRTQDIAVVGMAGRYPKAKNLPELWENLTQGRNCINEIPADRYAWRLQHGNSVKYRGGFLEDIDKFDSLFFNISPREAEMVDPQERLFLEVAWEAIEDAGYYPEILGQEESSRNIGVYVGAVWAMYQMLSVEEKYAGNKIVPNSFFWSIANRVSYWLNLSGPSMTVDTACSSSLTAIYLACEAMRAGECSSAIVGGVNLDLHQAKLDINWAGGALSPDGVCRSFGKGANGYVAGEGVGALFLKPLEQAVEHGDNIYGIIKSAAVNHGGRTSGYTVPNPKAQSSLIAAALEKAGIDARSISYIEAHGTGTELGDPIEITGLSNAFSADKVENQSCAIGSIKSNIGHLEAAAGVVSISKVLLQMKHRQLVPSLHSAELNEFIDFKNSPFHVVQRMEEWNAKEVDGVRFPLRAGISSFGAGGTNAHIILESYEPGDKANAKLAETRELVFPLSARNEEQLRETATRLVKFLEKNRVDLNDVAYTLQLGRKSFDHRVAIIAKTHEELVEKLTGFLAGKKAEDIVAGHGKSADGITRLLNRREKEEFVRLLAQRRDPRKLAELWVEGLLADWHGIQTHGSGKRVSLPTYPFADKRHWVYERSLKRRALQQTESMHPLVDSNESTFDRQLFKKTFSDRDFFIYDHHVADIPTLPGVAYLELARKAGEIAAGRKVQKIRNILWVSPIAVQNAKPKEVYIELKPSEATVRFEVFSNGENGSKVPHSQGILLYETKQEAAAEPEYIDVEAVRARCTKATDGKTAYPLFKSFGLNLGPSFQVLQDVYKNDDNEILGVLKLPESRLDDLESMVLLPSMVDGSLQAGVSALLGGKGEEMFVPFSIGEVEILHPLQPNCFSYVTLVKEDKKGKRDSGVVKSNLLILDEAGKVLVKIRDSVGVPLRQVHKKDGDLDGFSKLYYAYDWEHAALEAAVQTVPASVVLFASDEVLRDQYQTKLKAAGVSSDSVILVRAGESFEDLGQQAYKVNPQSKEDFTRLFECLLEKQHVVDNICFAWPLHSADLGDKQVKESLERGVYSFLYLCQSLIKTKLESKVQLLYLYSTKPGEGQPHNEAVTGFVNALRLEHPKLLVKALEVCQESAGYEQVLGAVAAEFGLRMQDANAVRYESHERSIKKLKAFDLEEAVSSQGVSLRENGVYLITGGAGGLGLIFAEFLAREFKAKVVLTGRSKLSAEREAKLEALRKLGGDVLYLPADVSNQEDVKKLISESKARFGEIHGIIHAAGVLRDSLIRNKTTEELSAVCAPKVYGTLHLDEAMKEEKLDFFVTFSSLSAVAGNAGQCDYSFANHFMDSFAAQRERMCTQGIRFGKTLSINWSLWAEGGMKLDEQTEIYFQKNLGIKGLSSASGLDAFVRGLASTRSQFVMLEGVQEKVELAWGLRKKDPALVSANQATAAEIPEEVDGELVALLEKDLSQIVMEFLKLGADDIEVDKVLLDMGFDSIGLTTFANAVNEKYQLDITPVLFFDFPTIGEIARHLAAERNEEIRRAYGSSVAAKSGTPQAAQQSATQQLQEKIEEAHSGSTFNKGWNPAALDRDAMDRAAMPVASGAGFSAEHRFINMPIAIVGMSGVMPQSRDVAEFWENLKNSKDMITVIPRDRWRWEDFYGDPLKEANKSRAKWGGFMHEVDKFDPQFFGILQREAQMMDPQQRIFLETVWKAIEDSGHKVSDLSGTRTGLFVGVATNDYKDLMNSLHAALDGFAAPGNSHSVLANRVSFLLNLRGPSAPLDTACSSSLIALHRAVESIHTGSCDMAIVGGVQVMLTPAANISFGMAGMLSGDGKCKTFDKRADGYVRGEGSGAIFLKPLSAAEADGNHIYAVIKATAENHGGRVPTLTAPNSAAQSALLIEAYEKAQIDPTTVGYIECHGTGTVLGDPIETQALTKAFAELYKRNNKAPTKTPHCGLSSVKTNIGHLETAAGVASLLKTLLAIQHKQIPANLHFEEINPYINLKGTPFYIAGKLTPWEAAIGEDGLPLPRRAGVSSFGFGGANAHIVLEEHIAPQRKLSALAQGPQLIVLSAKNEDRLKAYMQSLHAYLEKTEVELMDLAYTLQVGRDEMPERVALVVSSVEDIRRKLEEILKRGETPKDCYRDTVKNRGAKSTTANTGNETAVQALIEQKELSQLAKLWVSGAKIDWRLLYKPEVPRRISAPTYPFARERYWFFDLEEKTVITAEEKTTAVEKAIPEKEITAEIQHSNGQPKDLNGHREIKTNLQEGAEAGMQSLVPIWNQLHLESSQRNVLPESNKIMLLASESSQLDWLRKSYPNSQMLQLTPAATVESIAKKLAESSFDQLLWIAPDAGPEIRKGDEQIIAQQEEGVLAVFRIIKALVQAGYANKKLQWTIVTSKTQRVTANDRVQPAHAGIAGLVGTLALEYSHWKLRLLDVDSLTALSAQECLSLPWDQRGNALAHRRSEWFQQGLAPMAKLVQGTPVYRRNGVYVVIGGAGGLGEVWSRFMIEHYQANVVWIGRRKSDAMIEEKINSLAKLGPAPLYISADATSFDSLEQASKTILKIYPAIHGVVHSAIVAHGQTIARMEESGFRAGLSAKVDISVNMDRVFGEQELDFMLFFSSMISFFKTPEQSNYAAGCTFKDSFAQKMQQQRTYPVKVMNWGYWGSVGVVADELHRKIMEGMGIGSIEPQEGMAALEAFVSSDTRQVVLIKTLNSQATARLSRNLSESLAASPARTEVTIASNQEYVAPRSEMEEQLIGIWAEVLNLPPEKIGINDSFFELGGHSLLATQLLSQIRSRFGIDLPLMALFQHTSVAQFAELIEKADESDIPPIQPVDRAKFERLPLSFAQERVWFFDQLEPGSARYNLPGGVVLRGELDVNQLDQAFNLIVARHENLRTLFPSEEGQAQQLILDSLDFKLERIDLSHYESKEARDNKAKLLFQSDAAMPFDLARGPLLRGKVIKLAEDEHILMLNMHHIISDGWSMGILMQELSLIMDALRQGQRPELTPLPIQYADYSVWQRAWLEDGGVLKQQLAYWQKKLAGVPESLELPTDYPRPGVRSFAGAVHAFDLDAQLTSQLKSLAEQKGGTLFMVLLAAFKVLLYRYTKQSDICTGTLIANRQYGETEGLIGMFVNTLALRSQIEDEDTFSALLSQVKATCLEAYEHQDTPFERVVDMLLRRQRNVAINPIFQVMFILQNTAFGEMDHRLQRYSVESGISEFDLSVEFSETSEGLAGSLEYSTALFKPQTIARMAEHFVTLCWAITAAPTARIRDLKYIGEAEEHQLLTGYNNTQAEFPKDKCIHELFAEQARINPEKTAVVFNEQELTYQQLYERSQNLALYLQLLGIKPDSVVGLCMEPSLEMMVATMATAQAGGAYMPLDPGCSTEKLAYMLQDSQAAIVFTQERFRGKLRSLLAQDAKLIPLDKQWSEIDNSVADAKAKSAELRQEVKPHNLGYIIYTSGSTGKPKGVQVEHQAIVNRIHWMQKSYSLHQGDVVLQEAPYSSDVSAWKFFWPMMVGASVVFTAGGYADVHSLENLIHKAKVTTLHLAPPMLNEFIENASRSCNGVSRLFCSGEVLDRTSVDRYKIKFPHASLYYLFGPTEAGGVVTAYDCSELNHPIVLIGAPIANTQIYILDQHNQPQPIGIPGELCIAGAELARGYLNRPEVTQEKFIANPFLPGKRMYKTGKLARWMDDGTIQYLGESRQCFPPERTGAMTAEAEIGGGQVLEKIAWQEEALLDENYEKVTF